MVSRDRGVAFRTNIEGIHSTSSDELKDAVLARIADTHNVASFVSFGPGPNPKLRFARMRTTEHDHLSLEGAIDRLFDAADERMVNVRSFKPGTKKSLEFVYGLRSNADVCATIRRLALSGHYTIANETIDVSDGGVSGVSYGGVVEFAPEDTPRCVEKPGVASLPKAEALNLLGKVYGFHPKISLPGKRVEFSLHPGLRGVRREHTIFWEVERSVTSRIEPRLSWPNRFSEFLGDKAYGLLVANVLGLRVPRTRYFGRSLPPFEFGQATRTGDIWLRTCPYRQMPGKYPTVRGWTDPFKLMQGLGEQREDVRSIIVQDGVKSEWSGAAIAGIDGKPIIEGVSGFGDDFMLGNRPPEEIPLVVSREVVSIYGRTARKIGPFRMEWAYDGAHVWVLQFHLGRTESSDLTIVAGQRPTWYRFNTKLGLEALRELVEGQLAKDQGIILEGSVGITSHFADLLRRAGLPSKIEQIR